MNFVGKVYHLPSLLLMLLLVSACGSNKLITGRKNFEQGEYFLAIANLREAYPKLKDKGEKAETAYLLGTSYKQLGDYTKAVPWLKNSIRYQYPDETLLLKLAETNKAAGKMEESISLFKEYLLENPNELLAKNGLKGTEEYLNWEKEPTLYIVEKNKKLSSTWNDRAISFVKDDDKVVISTSSEKASGKATSPVDGQKFADIFYAEYDSSSQNWEIPSKFETPELNTSGAEGHISYSLDGTKLLISRASISKNGQEQYQLFFSKKVNNKWTPPQQIHFCTDGAQYPQASWSADGSELYFSSNRPGGIGGFDIWKSSLNENGQFNEPVNLGSPINTPGNEIYPFERHKDVLYFSSDFHLGAGAQDIFKASRNQGEWVIKNMGLPINSFADDMGVVFSKEGEKGFFISNRKGSRGLDIYSFLLPPRLFMCFGKVSNEQTDSIIPNVNIRVLGSDGSVNRLTTSNGEFWVELLPDNEYTLIAYKKGYLNAQAKISTKGLSSAKEFKLDFTQTPTDEPIQLEQIYYKTGKWDLLPATKKALDELVEILNINPEIRIELSAHTDEVGDDVFNLELSQKRANEVIRYLKEQGVNANRLEAKGYGEKRPLIVNAKIAKDHGFLKIGDRLSADFISTLTKAQQEIAKSLNRRTEFEVLNK